MDLLCRAFLDLLAQEIQLSQLLCDVVRRLQLLQVRDPGVEHSNCRSQALLSVVVLLALQLLRSARLGAVSLGDTKLIMSLGDGPETKVLNINFSYLHHKTVLLYLESEGIDFILFERHADRSSLACSKLAFSKLTSDFKTLSNNLQI